MKAKPAFSVLLAAGVLSLTSAAQAEPDVAELAYERPADLDGCPDEAALRLAVIERLRRDPFVRGAERKIQVRISRSGPRLIAVVSVEEAGQSRGQRRIETHASCAELGSAAALAVSIAVDPTGSLLAPDPGEPSSKEPPPPGTPKPRRAPEPRAARKLVLPRPSRDAGLDTFLQVGVRGWAGAAPRIGVGPSLGFAFRRGAWSIALDALGVLPESQTVAGTPRAISVGLLAAQLSPCLHASHVRGCALLTAGALFAEGRGVAEPRSQRAWYASAGVGIGYSVTLGNVSLTPLAEAQLRLETAQLSIADQLAWTTPRALVALGVEVGYRLVH